MSEGPAARLPFDPTRKLVGRGSLSPESTIRFDPALWNACNAAYEVVAPAGKPGSSC